MSYSVRKARRHHIIPDGGCEAEVTLSAAEIRDIPPQPKKPLVARYYPLVITGTDGLVVTLHADGTPEFGPGVTAENVWRKIAEAMPQIHSPEGDHA